MLRKIIFFMTAITLLACSKAQAGSTIIELWTKATPPPVPKVQPVTVDAHHTALLILDIEERTCDIEQRPRCLETVPHIAALMKSARAQAMPVIYSQITRPTPILPEVLPAPGDPIVSSGVNKFYHTDLEDILKMKKINTVIITGTAAHGAVLHTATGAAMRGLSVVIPVDCLSGASLYTEQAAVWCLINGPGTRRNTTLTTSDLITIH